MDISAISAAVTQFGFPIVLAAVLIWMMYKFISANNARYDKLIDDQNARTAELIKEHKAETDKLADAINNNTLVMTKLLDRIGGEGK